MFIYPSPDASFVLHEFSITMFYCHSEVKGVTEESGGWVMKPFVSFGKLRMRGYYQNIIEGC